MNCLKFEEIDKYLEKANTLSDEQKRSEARKNYYLCTHIKRGYNAVRSHIYLEFADVLVKMYDAPSVDLTKLKSAILTAIKWCETYFDISLIYTSFDKEDKTINIDCKANEAMISFARTCYLRFNSLVVFCSEVRELSKYLLKKIFNETLKVSNSICVYGDENPFNTEDDVKKYEKENVILASSNIKEILDEALSVFEGSLRVSDSGMI